MYTTDKKGKWKVDNNVKMLIEPSESYLTERDLERQKQDDEELINRLKPTEKEVLMAEIELNILNLLTEMEVL